MKRLLPAMCAGLFILLSGACVAPGPILPLAGTSTVLFDPVPGPISANELVFRGEWPAAESRLSLGETTYFREVIFDQQSLNRFSNDFSFRRFQAHRIGTSVR